MTPKEVGERDGIEAARKGLVEHQRIAAAWAEARLALIEDVPGESDYRAGYRAGYRDTLTQFVQTASRTV